MDGQANNPAQAELGPGHRPEIQNDCDRLGLRPSSPESNIPFTSL